MCGHSIAVESVRSVGHGNHMIKTLGGIAPLVHVLGKVTVKVVPASADEFT